MKDKMKGIKLVTVSALCSASLLSQASQALPEPGGYMYFFEQGLPSNISASKQSEIEIEDEVFKDGNHSLEWEFEDNSELIFNQQIGYHENDNSISPQTFMAWIYNKEPQNGQLTFEFGTDNRIDTSFVYSLNFSGWRGISVPFRDMNGEAKDKMNRLTVRAPSTSGEVYLDQIMLSVPVDNRWPTPDYQQPFVNKDVSNMASKNWTALLMYDRMLKAQHPTFDFDTAFDDTNGETALIYQNFDTHLGVNSNKTVTDKQIKSNLKGYQAFNITIDDNEISGVPLDHPKRRNFLKTGIVSDSTYLMLSRVKDIRSLGKLMLKTAKYLRSNTLSSQQRSDLETAFINATRYSLDQGWQAGSGFQIITHVGYQTREYFDAMFLARRLLANSGLLKSVQQSMMWFNATGRIYEKESDIVAANVDVLNTQLQWMIKSFLLLPNSNERNTMLTQLQTWLSKTLLASNGLGGGFKPDGSVFHHSQLYPAYGKDAFNGLSGAIYGLSSSPFELSDEAHRLAKNVLLKMRIYTKETMTPIVLSGRHPDGKQKISPTPFKWMALAGTPDNTHNVDPQLAAAFASLTHKPSFQNINAEPEPIGVWAMNYASMAIARGRSPINPNLSWLAIARGFSRYLVGNETYQSSNLYGRYLQYGQLEIMPSDLNHRSFSHDGWDWNRYPGTTTIHLPNQMLKANIVQLPSAGIEEMLLSTERYSGANALDTNTAMFAMKLRGHKKYDQQDFHAQKSYFFFDNSVVALGTGITNTDSKHQTETTLFQAAVPNLEPVTINGQSIQTLGDTEVFTTDVNFVDTAGNQYFVKTGKNQTVNFQYIEQQSNSENSGNVTTGKFASAVINHGKAPVDGQYEYAINIEAQNDLPPSYTVLSHNQQLHAVRWANDVEAYAFFKPVTNLSANQIVIASDSPVQIIAKPKSQSVLLLSVVNPDLAFYTGTEPDQIDENGDQVEVSIYGRTWRYSPSQSVSSTITVKGKWSISQPNEAVKTLWVNGNTQITVKTTDATPMKVKLNK
ncbi:MAG: chondroitinase [Aliivibrio sp.]|uniref:chondroitinase family polysaccharide lyase n=1 Tax=Aliivibrio sp. TaxID=1872443 RepID=UPI001A4DD44B|nr:chondroitinase [Aliivibrio sp.]